MSARAHDDTGIAAGPPQNPSDKPHINAHSGKIGIQVPTHERSRQVRVPALAMPPWWFGQAVDSPTAQHHSAASTTIAGAVSACGLVSNTLPVEPTTALQCAGDGPLHDHMAERLYRVSMWRANDRPPLSRLVK